MDDLITIDCQHIEENTSPFRLYMPIGDKKVVRLCLQCQNTLNGIVLTDVISDAVSRGIFVHASNTYFTESVRGLVRDELLKSLKEAGR